jgi:putative transposon-encoded protein
MKIIKLNAKTELTIKNIKGFLKRKVTPFGTSAKVDCPKEYLGKTVYLIITDE